MTTDDNYYMVLNGKNKTGPFQTTQVVKMLESGTIRDDTPIWQKGMESWDTVGGIRHLLLPDEPPPFDPAAMPPQVTKEPTPTTPPEADDKNREAILELQAKLAALPDDASDVRGMLERQKVEQAIREQQGIRPKAARPAWAAPKGNQYHDYDPHRGGGAHGDYGSGMIQPSPGKSAGVAAALSFVLVGAGQMYLGQIGKGIAILVGTLLFGGCSGLAFWPLLLIAAPMIWIVAAIDAYMIGQKLESGQAVSQWEFFGG